MKMKGVYLFVVLVSVFFQTNAQKLITADTIYKVGIYKDFEEFKYNNPSIKLDYPIKKESIKCGIFGSGEIVDLYHLTIDKKEGKAIGYVFGFSDGKNVYLSPFDTVKLRSSTDFYKIEYFEENCYLRGIFIVQGKNFSSIYLRGYLLNIKTGKITILEQNDLLDIIARDKEISTDFNKQSHKKKKISEYVLKYLKKHKGESI